MKRIKTYVECKDCIYFANPDKCEYTSCKECPNYASKGCACILEIPEGEKRCPYFKDNGDEYLENDYVSKNEWLNG